MNKVFLLVACCWFSTIYAQEDLLKKADAILAKAKIYSVMDKVQIPPSGDKHDYMSQGPY